MEKANPRKPRKDAGAGFNGTRLLQLNRERNRNSFSRDGDDDNVMQEQVLRRWQSLNEAAGQERAATHRASSHTNSSSGGDPRSSLSPRNGTPMTTTYYSSSSSRGKHKDDPVVWVLKDPEETSRELLSSRLSIGFDTDQRQKERHTDTTSNDNNLKYPHGMPRWGPKATTSRDASTATAQAGNKSRKGKSTDDPSSTTDASKHTRLSHQELVVEKAKEQSFLAATRAIENLSSKYPSPSLYQAAKTNPNQVSAGGGLKSRLFRRGKPSLLQSARLQQTRIIDHGSHPLSHATPQDENSKVAPVQSFEYLNETKSDSTDSEEEAGVNDNNASSPVMDDCGSWSMASCQDDIECESESKASVADFIPPHLQRKAHSSIPNLAPSEIDQESSSRHSDYSSIVVNDSLEIRDNTDDCKDHFFETRTGETPRNSSSARFNANRCRELFLTRYEYFEKEERQKIISPKAVQRLSSLPSLTKDSDEAALQELASRGRWMYNSKSTTRNDGISLPATVPLNPYTQQSTLLPVDAPKVEPIILRAPNTMPATIRQTPWHKALKEDAQPQDGYLMEQQGQGMLPSGKNEYRISRQELRALTVSFVLIVIWAIHLVFHMYYVFIVESGQLGSKGNARMSTGIDEMHTTSFRNHSLPLGITYTSVEEIFWPPTLTDLTDCATEPPTPPPSLQKCPANLTNKYFWEALDKFHKTTNTDETFLLSNMLSNQNLRFFVDMSPSLTICDDEFSICFESVDEPPANDTDFFEDLDTCALASPDMCMEPDLNPADLKMAQAFVVDHFDDPTERNIPHKKKWIHKLGIVLQKGNTKLQEYQRQRRRMLMF